MPLEFRRFPELPDVMLVNGSPFGDERGWFMETFRASECEANGIPAHFPQDNHSHSNVKGVLRGLHYQLEPKAQGKLVRCVVGAIYDVAIDIRRGSPTYGRWVAAELSGQNRQLLWIPPGFAHGFCTMTEVTDVVYKTTAEYSRTHDRGIRWNDPTLGIKWPTNTPVLSPKDADAPFFEHAENTFVWQPR